MAVITVAQLAQWRLKNVNLKIFEKHDKPSGTWRWEPNEWSQDYAESDEIEAHFARIGKKYNLDSFTTYGTEVVGMEWSEERQAWKLDLKMKNGERKESWTHVVINGQNILHTAGFDRSIPLEGKKVAVIGNGSSGIQVVGTIGWKCELQTYQRSNTWIVNQHKDQLDAHKFSPEELAHYKDRKNTLAFFKGSWPGTDAGWTRMLIGSPEYEAGNVMAKENLEKLVRDPVLRAMLTPTYPSGCRRSTPHEHYFDVLQLPTTTIIKDHIERFTEKGIIAGGIERECDVIIKTTGFNVDYNPTFTVTGRNGVTLQKAWEEYPFTYRSVMSSGFPNLFHCMGPNAPVALSSIHMFGEQQIAYAIQVIQHMQVSGITLVDPKADAEKEWHEKIQEGSKATVYNIDCGGWYKHKSGMLTSHYPGPPTKFMDEIFNPIWDELNVTRLSDVSLEADLDRPREPNIPSAETEVNGAAEKLASTSI